MSEMRTQGNIRQVSGTKACSGTPQMDFGISLPSRTQMEAPDVAFTFVTRLAARVEVVALSFADRKRASRIARAKFSECALLFQHHLPFSPVGIIFSLWFLFLLFPSPNDAPFFLSSRSAPSYPSSRCRSICTKSKVRSGPQPPASLRFPEFNFWAGVVACGPAGVLKAISGTCSTAIA